MVWPIRSRNSSQVSGLLSMALGSRKPCSTRTLLRDTSPSYMAPICGTVTCDSSITSRKSSGRSEEHTSELQSPYDLGCRLLLEKKNDLPNPMRDPRSKIRDLPLGSSSYELGSKQNQTRQIEHQAVRTNYQYAKLSFFSNDPAP